MSQMVSWKKKGIRAIIEARAQEEEQVAGRGRAHRDYVPDEHEKDYLKKLYDKINNPQRPTEEDLLGPDNPNQPPIDLASGMPPDLNTPWLPGGQKTDGIPNITNPKLKKKLQQKKGIKGTDAELFPLAKVDYTSPNPKFDEHMKKTPPLNKPKERIDHLNEGVRIRKA